MAPIVSRVLGVAAAAAWLASAAGAADVTPQEVAALLAAGHRPTADMARDAGRKPADVVAFLDIAPGMTVVDLIAAGGYYTEVLSLAVGDGGVVYAQNTKFALEIRDGANDKAMTERLAGNRLPNVRRLDHEFDALGLEPGSVDAAITALNFHDIYNGGGPAAADGFLAAVYSILKPGGVFGIVDHAGGVGDDKELHRIDEDLVIAAATRAGFELQGASEVLRNPDDARTLNVFDPAIRGKTDRFVLRLRKPGGDVPPE